MIVMILMVVLTGTDGPEAAARLSAEDLPAYHAALRANDHDEAPVVTFADLWRHDGQYRNRRVAINGRVVRRFSQPPIGRFPALTEFWIVNDRGEPFCVVAPSAVAGLRTLAQYEIVRFRGTYLRPIRYEAAGGERFAPLLVASEGPERVVSPNGPRNRPSNERWIAVGLAGLVAVALLVQFLRRPARRTRTLGAGPSFLQPEEEADPGTES